MDTILLFISVALAGGATIYGFYIDPKKPGRRIIFIILALIGIGFTFFIAYKDSKQIIKIDTNVDSLRISSAKAETILIDANDQLSDQSEKLSEGFQKINDQLTSLNGGNSTIISQVKNLEIQVSNFAKTSVDFNTQAIGLLTQGASPDPSTTMEFKIPMGDNNAKEIDSKHSFSVASDKPDEKNNITILYWNHRAIRQPGQRVTTFKNDKGQNVYLDYQGIEEDKYFVFRVHL